MLAGLVAQLFVQDSSGHPQATNVFRDAHGMLGFCAEPIQHLVWISL